MSLLLQALKQIELKAPGNLSLKPDTDASESAIAGEGDASSAVGAPSGTGALNTRLDKGPSQAIADTRQSDAVVPVPPDCATIELIRQYEDSETATEFALADPPRSAVAPLSNALVEPSTRHKSWDDERRRRFASDVVRLLPNDDPAIIALAPVARRAGDVLAIARMPVSVLKKPTLTTRFSDILSFRQTWQTALSSAVQDGFHAIERGDDEILAMVAGRSLLKLWQELTEQFAYVVVDAGPAESAAVTGLLTSCENTFAVVRLNRTQPHEAERLVRRIQSIGGRPCGCLVVE
jgi:hypothetical protein